MKDTKMFIEAEVHGMEAQIITNKVPTYVFNKNDKSHPIKSAASKAHITKMKAHYFTNVIHSEITSTDPGPQFIASSLKESPTRHEHCCHLSDIPTVTKKRE
jgi:hypothetical protein